MNLKKIIALSVLIFPLSSYALDLDTLTDSTVDNEQSRFEMEISSIGNGAFFTPKIYDVFGNEVLHYYRYGHNSLSPEWTVSCQVEDDSIAKIETIDDSYSRVVPTEQNHYDSPFAKVICTGTHTRWNETVSAEKTLDMRINQVKSTEGYLILSKITKLSYGYKVAFAKYDLRGRMKPMDDFSVMSVSYSEKEDVKSSSVLSKGYQAFGLSLHDKTVKGNVGSVIVSFSGDKKVELGFLVGKNTIATLDATLLKASAPSKTK